MTVLAASYRSLRAFLLFWRDFLIGDDWWGAGLALLGLGFTYLASRYGVAPFWIPVVFVTGSLAQNLWRMKRRANRTNSGAQAVPPQADPPDAIPPGR